MMVSPTPKAMVIVNSPGIRKSMYAPPPATDMEPPSTYP